MPFPLPLRTVGAVAATLTIAAPVGAGSFDACAQRVIRDWYSGGQIDGVYPLACYRAAIRALPEDVRQYSDADKDIARALAYARRGRRDPGNAPPPSSVASAPASSVASAPAETPPATVRRAPPESRVVARPRPRVSTPRFDGSVRLADAPAVDTAGASLPYPLLGLATLALLLLLSAAAAAVRARRR